MSKQTYETLVKTKEELVLEQQTLNQKWDALTVDNRYQHCWISVYPSFIHEFERNLKSSLLDAERYKEEYREETEIVAMLKKKMKEVLLDIEKTREDLQKARMDSVMPKYGKHAPKFNKDTKVNLDMSMWITHNITKEEQETYVPEIKYYEAPYEAPKKYYEPEEKYEKYEEPKYEAPEEKYEEEKYEEPKYEEPKYEKPKYEEPKYAEPEADEEPY